MTASSAFSRIFGARDPGYPIRSDMTPEAELLEIIASYQRHVDDLAIWSTNSTRVHALLEVALRPRAESFRRGLEVIDFPWETLIDLVLEWHYAHPSGDREVVDQDVFNALDLALKFTRITPLEVAIRTGAYRIRKTGNDFRVHYQWNMAPEVADLYLERRSSTHETPEPSPAELEWAAKQDRKQLNKFEPPIALMRRATDRALTSIKEWQASTSEGHLADDFDLGDGLTVRSMTEVLSVLMAIAQLGELAHARVRAPGVTLVHAHRSAIIDWMKELCSNSTKPAIDVALDRLTAGLGRSVRRSLLVPNGEIVTFLPLLLFPRAFDSLMLRTAAYNPGTYGPIGQRQGNQANVWAKWFSAVSGTQVAERLKVRDATGKVVGDLDVVALDATTMRGAVFEIKWPIDAVTLPETLKIEGNITAAARQLGHVRKLLREGESEVQLPRGWPAFRDVEWTWCVGTPRQLTARPLPEPEMTAISMQYLASLGEVDTLTDVLGLLEKPDWPQAGSHYTVQKTTIELDRHRIHMDSLHLKDVDWLPRVRRSS
ncbi:hypothetical protein ABZ342_47850 [Amycolatopsis sp. NPDC005961]|uniref:hypothetical protein n=1 Tax=Amycolatopsis sp. NPDC005961 TaxID=3156720 RepID=UPI0033E5A7C6